MEQLSYDANEVSMVSMQLAYESVIHVNSGVPQPISNNSYLSEIFGNQQMDGDVMDYPSVKAAPAFSSLQSSSGTSSQTFQPYDFSTSTNALSNSTGSVGTGALSSFGNFNFGSLSQTQQTAIGTELSALAAQNPHLAAALNLTSSNSSAPSSNLLVNPYNSTGSLDAQAYDVAQAAAQAAAGTGLAASGIDLAAALMAAAMIEASPNAASIVGTEGAVNPTALVYAALNAAGSGTVQLGSTK